MQKSQQNPKEAHTELEWRRKFFGMGAKCYYCHVPLKLKEASKDHKIPRCRGGSDQIRNIVPACLPCNQKKGWRTEKEFLGARPAFEQNAQESRAIEPKTYTDPVVIPDFSLIDDPHLVVQLRKEEREVSWAWKHPVPPLEYKVIAKTA